MYLVKDKPVDNKEAKEISEKNKRFQLARLLRFTEQMLRAAQQEDWDVVEEMEALRRAELDECFSVTQEDDSSDVIAEALATLSYLNDQIIKLVEQAKNNVVDTQNQLIQGKRAINQYQNI